MAQFLVRRSIAKHAVGQTWCLEVIVGARTVASFDFNEKLDAMAELDRLKSRAVVKQGASRFSNNH